MVTAPIWKDTAYTVTGASGTIGNLSYHIDIIPQTTGSTNETIFQGKAYPAPKATELKVNINRICENYLSNELVTLGRNIVTGTSANSESCKVFGIYNNDNVLLESYRFIYNWEYDFEFSSSSDVSLSRAINGHRAANMLLMGSWWSHSDNKTHNTVSYSGITIGGTSIYPVTACGEYALYYLNTAGGWDSFLIEGIVRKKDKYEKYYTNNIFDNNTLDFEKRAYNNQIVSTYELNTHYLTDEESARLATHLLASNRVYLHNLCTGDIKPVILTDAEADYKTYKTEGRKMAAYKINVEESQTRQNI